MTGLRAANLGVKFALELAAVTAFVAWGAELSIVVAVLAGVVAIGLWGTFAAPKSRRRLATSARIPFELAFFALACVALAAIDQLALAVVLGVVVVLNAALLTAFGDWEL